MTDRNDNTQYLESSIQGDVVIVSEVPPDDVMASLGEGLVKDAAIHKALASWAEDANPGDRNKRSLFQRNKYVTPGKIFGQMAMAYDALDDDIVGNVADTSEAIALQKIKFEHEDEQQSDIWAQIGRDLNLDQWLRQAWRELFTVSQFYGVRWWGQKTYKVRGKGEKGKRAARKEFNLTVPVGLGLLDPVRVVPVKQDLFGNVQLAWIASETEKTLYKSVMDGKSTQTDDLVKNLFLGQYKPTKHEEKTLQKEDIEVDNLLLLNPQFVFRHTLTKSPFERWSRVRMKSVFPILDLKHQLREMDRAFLLGGINFLVLVTRGTDTRPTSVDEVSATSAQIRAQSKSPVIVSDHRIKIEIITPDIEHVLNDDKWSVLDERLVMRLWGTFNLLTQASNRETSLTLGRVIARGLAARRHMLKRTIEQELIRPVGEINEDLDIEAKLTFFPSRMELEFDSAVATQIQEMRDRGDLSRDTVLSEFGFDQDMEAVRRQSEDKKYKDVFEPVNVPFDSPEKTTPGGAGRKGGRPAGKPGDDSKDKSNE